MQTPIGVVKDEFSTTKESELIALILQGQHAAFAELISRNHDQLYSSMLKRTRSADFAEEIVQDTFVQAFLKLHQFQNRSSFSTWLFRIGFNKFLVFRRRQIAMAAVEKTFEEGFDPIDTNASAESLCVRAETRSIVGEALERLDRKSRLIIVLREFKGLTYEQIGERLRIRPGTVRSRLSRARHRLLKELNQSSTLAVKFS